jgi:hypothetical protein
VQEDRNGVDGNALIARDQIRGARHLGHVELAIAQEAPMPRARIHSREHIEVDTIGLDRPVHECAHDLVLAAG